MAHRRLHFTLLRQLIQATPEISYTPWFPRLTRPNHVGWYHVKSDGDKFAARFWDGTRWMLVSTSTKEKDVSEFQNWIWRGLLENALKPPSRPIEQAKSVVSLVQETISRAAGREIPVTIRPRVARLEAK